MEKGKNRKEKRERKEARILNNALVYGRGNCRRRRIERFSRVHKRIKGGR
jgi:hypothetical protein